MPETAVTALDEKAAQGLLQRLTDEELVQRIRAGETGLFELLMRRYNQRLYRAARAIVKDDSLAEDVMQEVRRKPPSAWRSARMRSRHASAVPARSCAMRSMLGRGRPLPRPSPSRPGAATAWWPR